MKRFTVHWFREAVGVVICACVVSAAHAQTAVEKPRYTKLDSVLDQLVVDRTAGVSVDAITPGAVRPTLSQLGLIEYGEGQVGVTIRFRGPGQTIRDFVTTHNGHIAYNFDGAIEAYIDVAFLPDLDALEETDHVDAIRRPEPQVISQGVQIHNAPSWQAAGYSGQGVKVGIIDGGFMGWSSLPVADMPSVGGARCYTGGGFYTTSFPSCQTGSNHGTAVAESIHDFAPSATYYLANPISNGDVQNAVQWMTQQGVRVINMSLSKNWDGPGDGTSPYADSPLKAVDAAIAGGAMVTISSGNYGKAAWFGPWQDSNADGFLDLASGRTCLAAFSLEFIAVELRWQDSWGGATRDLDMGLYRFATGTLVASSTNVQAGGAGHVPHELLSYTAPTAGLYCVGVMRYAGAAPGWVQLRVASKQTLDVFNTATSVTSPAETGNAGALAVGAANWQTPSTIEDFSGSGPTVDGRIKPDIVGVDKADSFTYGPNGFAGTSQSAPHVAGLAALLVQGYSSKTPAQIATMLKNWALPRGAVPNNTWGYGLAYLLSVYNLTVSRAGTGTGTVTSLDSSVNCGSACVSTHFSGDAVTLTAVAAAGSAFTGWTGGGCSGNGACTLTIVAPTQVTATFVTSKVRPTITWATPAAITYGTALSAAQLNATANVAGTFVYSPSIGTVLSPGTSQTLSVTFTPTDTTNYTTATKSVVIDVTNPAPTFTDNPVTSATTVKAIHITEMRQAIDSLRARFGLSVALWTDSSIVAGVTLVKAVHLTEMRSALDAVYAATHRTVPTYTYATLTGGATIITSVDIAELRAAILAVW